eukprot:g7764.t1
MSALSSVCQNVEGLWGDDVWERIAVAEVLLECGATLGGKQHFLRVSLSILESQVKLPAFLLLHGADLFELFRDGADSLFYAGRDLQHPRRMIDTEVDAGDWTVESRDRYRLRNPHPLVQWLADLSSVERVRLRLLRNELCRQLNLGQSFVSFSEAEKVGSELCRWSWTRGVEAGDAESILTRPLKKRMKDLRALKSNLEAVVSYIKRPVRLWGRGRVAFSSGGICRCCGQAVDPTEVLLTDAETLLKIVEAAIVILQLRTRAEIRGAGEEA